MKIWQKSRLIVKKFFILTRNFPAEEKFGLDFSNFERVHIQFHLILQKDQDVIQVKNLPDFWILH